MGGLISRISKGADAFVGRNGEEPPLVPHNQHIENIDFVQNGDGQHLMQNIQDDENVMGEGYYGRKCQALGAGGIPRRSKRVRRQTIMFQLYEIR